MNTLNKESVRITASPQTALTNQIDLNKNSDLHKVVSKTVSFSASNSSNSSNPISISNSVASQNSPVDLSQINNILKAKSVSQNKSQVINSKHLDYQQTQKLQHTDIKNNLNSFVFKQIENRFKSQNKKVEKSNNKNFMDILDPNTIEKSFEAVEKIVNNPVLTPL